MEQYFIGQVTLKAILKYKDAFVLVREKNEDKYILPGGRLNVGENPENGIRREIKEELSVDCNIENIISVGAYHGGDISKNPKFFVYYLASVTPNQEIIINNEIAEFVLISKKEELENYPTYQSYKDALTPSSILTTYKDIAGTTHTKQDTYTYDNLARLTQVSTSYDSGTAIADTLTYDPIGNIIKENDVLYRYSQDGMQNAHGVTSIGSSHISYDAQGNRIQSGDSAYSWNALNQLVSATSTNGTELYTYDENGERIKKVVQASTLLNQKVTPATATSTSGSFASGDLLTSFSTSSTYIATSTYNTLSSLSLLSTTTLFTLVSSYYGSPFTSKFCAATSTANRQSCIVATTKQLLANDINGKSTTTASTNGLITDIIKIATGEYLIPDSYVGLATSSIASSDGGLFSIDSGTISSYSTFTSTGIVVVMSQYSNLPYVSSSTYTSLQQIGLNDTSKVKALLILAGCTSMTSACTTAEKVVFEKYYKESGYLLSDKALQEMWYVFAQKARLPGNSNEFTSTSTTLGNITIPTVSGISTSTATTTYYSNLYFTSEYTIRNSAELRLQFFNTIPYLVTQSTFAELQQAGITQTTMENYIALISDLSIAPVSSSTDYVTALNLFINLDKKASLSITALRELYLVALGAATIPDSASDYTDVSIYDLAPYLTVQTYYGSSFTNTTSGCNGGIYSGGVGRCAIRVSPFSLPVSSSSVVTYLLTINANTFTEASLNVGESSNPRGAVDSYNYPTQLPLVYSYYYSPGTSVNGNDFYSGTISADGLFQTVDVTTTIEKQKASSTEPAVILVMNHSGWNTSQQNAYLSRNVYVKAHVNTPRLTVASTSLMTLASGYVTTYWTATTTPSVSTSNIRAYYKLENTSDSVNSYTLSNEGSVTFGGGKIDNAASLGSSNTTKYLHADSALGFTSNADPLTVTCWVNAASTPSSGTGYTIINKMNGSGFGGSGGLWRFSYYNNGGTPRLQAGNDYGYSGINYNVTLSTSTWYLVGFTFDGTTNSNSLKMYVNGTTTGYTNGYGNGSFDEHATTLSIGSNRNGSAEYWSGSIDECSVWKAALSETDMSNLYNGGSGVQYPFGYSGDSVEKVSTSTQTASIQASVENYFGEVYDSSNDITLPTSTTTIPLTFISHDAYNEFASTTLIDVYDLSKIFLATTTSLTCIANSSTTQCDKLNRESNFKQIVGSYSGFIPSDTAVEEFWMVHKGILTLPYSTTSASVLYASSTNPIIVVNSATTSVNVFLRSWLSSSLSTTTATTSINLSAIPVGVLTSLQYNATYSTSTFALATSTTIVSEATYNELLHTPLRAVSDVYTVFDYALPYATSSCSGQAATSSCVISAQKTKTKDTISAVSGFILSDAALEELYRVYSGSISIVPVSKFNSTDSTDYQSLIVPLDTTSAFTTFSTTTVGATSTPSSTTGNCSFGTSGATSSLCYILIPYLNSSITALNLSFYVSTTTMTTGTLTSYLSYMTQDATSTGATSTPSFSTTVSTSTITGTRSGTKFTFDLTSLYNAYLRSSSPRLILIPDGNATSTNMYSLSSTTLTITRLVTTPQINYQEFSATTTTTTTTTTQGANVSTSTLKAYYKLENVNDSVNSYTLTNVNSVPFNSGKIGNAGDLGTSNSTKYLYIDNTLGYTSNAQALSMSCWVNVSTAPSSGSVYTLMNKMNGNGFGGNGGLWRWYYYNNGGTPQLRVGNDYGSALASYNVTLTTGTWYQVGFTFSGSNAAGSLKLYVNGTSTASSNGYGNGNFEGYTNTLSLGSNRNGSADYWSGLMDECGVWNAELSSSEMSALYSSGNGVQYPFATTTTTTSTTTSNYGVNVAVPVPFDRGTISSYATTTATSTIDMTSAPQLDFSTSYLSALGNSIMKSQTTPGALATNNILYYKLDGNSTDSSASGYNGSDTSVSYSSGNGKITSGAGFNGSNSEIDVSSSLTDVANTSPMSFSFWVKTSTSGSFGWIATRQNNSNFHSQWDVFHNSSGQIGFLINPTNNGSDQLYVHSGTAINNNAWHHIVVTYSGSKLASGVKIYVDGATTSITTDTNNLSSASPTGVPVFIGNRGAAGSPFSGAIDEFGIWSRELSSSDVTQLYNSGSGYQYPFATSTAATSTYSGTYVDPVYGQLPTEPQQVLPAVNYPYATGTIATSTINRLTVSTTTSYTVYSPFSSTYSDDSRGTVTTYLTLNGVLVGTYSYQKGNEASTGKVDYSLSNYLGTPVLNTDEHGDVIEAGMTDAFGNFVYRDTRNDSALHTKVFTGHEYDDTTQLTYAHARYLDTKTHSFLSVDPIIYAIVQNKEVLKSGLNSKTFLTNPQSLNSYSYVENNPIIKTDPTGNATYIWDGGGGMTGIDTWNHNTYYESQDRAMLNSNASLGEANRWNLGLFYSQVKPEGPMDYKNNSENRNFYFFGGKLVTSEEFGNLNYGYTGTSFGFGKTILTDAAGAVQIATAGKTNNGPSLSNISGNYDDHRDTSLINTGVDGYNKSNRTNSSSGYAVASNVAYNSGSTVVLVKALSTLAALLKTVSLKFKK